MNQTSNKENKCLACGKPTNGMGQFCQACEALKINMSQIPEEQYKNLCRSICEELRNDKGLHNSLIEKLKSNWRFKAQVVAITLLALGGIIAVLDLIEGFTLTNFITRKAERMQSNLSNQMQRAELHMQTNTELFFENIEFSMRSTIASNFQDANVRRIMESVATNESKSLFHSQINPEIDTFKEMVSRKFGAVTKLTESISNKMTEIGENLKIQSLIVAAQSDDRRAFDELGKLAYDTNYSFHDQAFLAHSTIFADLNYLQLPTFSYTRLQQFENMER